MANRSPDEIRNDIEHTREELGETVEALAAKTDVKAHAHARIEEVKQQVEEVKQQAKATVDDVRHRVEAARASNGAGPGAALSAGTSRDPARLAREVAQRARLAASQNPMPVAAIAGFVGGLIVARLMRRR